MSRIPTPIRWLFGGLALLGVLAMPLFSWPLGLTAFFSALCFLFTLWFAGSPADPAMLLSAWRVSAAPRDWLNWLPLGLGLGVLLVWWMFWSPARFSKFAQSFAHWGSSEELEGSSPISEGTQRVQTHLPDGSKVGANWLWDDGGPGPLPKDIDLKPSNQLVAFLELEDSDDAARLAQGLAYLSVYRLHRFVGGRWVSSAKRPLRLSADESGWIWFGEEPSQRQRAEAVSYRLSVEVGSNLPVTVLQGNLGIEHEEVLMTGGVNPKFSDRMIERQQRYRGLSLPRIWGDFAPVEQLCEGKTDEVYLQPAVGELGSVVRQIAINLPPREKPLFQRVAALQRYFSEAFSYSLETENIRQIDPVVNFLLHEPRGHCELFATTGALLAREMGIPSRVVYGLAHGQFLQVSNLFAYRDRDAHAWTEIFVDAYGWVILDLTPSQDGELDSSSESVDQEEVKEMVAGWDKNDSSSGPNTKLWWSPVDLIAPASGILLVGFSIVCLRSRDSQVTENSAFSTDPDYLHRLLTLATAKGIRRPECLTLKELIEDLRERDVELKHADRLLTYHYGWRYEGQVEDPAKARQLDRDLPR